MTVKALSQSLIKRIQANPYPWLLVAICLLTFFTNLHGYPLFDVDEPRYMETAREFLVAPYDWITPHFNWIKRFDKPILYYWLIASTFKIIGVSEVAGRLVSAIAGLASVLALYGVLARHRSRAFAFIAAVILATCTEFYVLSRWAITDMTLSAFMVTTTLCLFMAIEKDTRWALLSGILCGLGLLTKGPVALALPGGITVTYLLLTQPKRWTWLFSWPVLVGAVLALAVAAPWYIQVTQANPGEFIEKFFLLHNVERFSNTVSSHKGPWFYYFIVLAIGATPWTLLLLKPGILRAAIQKIRNGLTSRGRTLWASYQGAQPTTQLAIVWLLLVFIFFSAAGTKLLTYILSLYPAVAILLAVILSSHYSKKVLYFVATGFIGLHLISNIAILPIVAQVSQEDMMAVSNRVVEDKALLATYGCKKPSLVFYTKSRVYYMETTEEQAANTPVNHVANPAAGDVRVLVKASDVTTYPKQPVYVLTRARHAKAFQEQYPSERLYESDKFSLFKLLHPENVPIRKDMNQ